MSYSIGTLKTELTGVMHGTTLSQVTGLNEVINRSARQLLADFDPLETVRIQQLSSPIFDKVYDYICPDDLKDDRIVDIRPLIKRSTADRFSQFYNQEFDMNKDKVVKGGLETIQYNNGLKTLRLAKALTAAILVDGGDDLTDNGTWVVGGNATNLRLDTLNYVYGSGSVEFDVSAGGSSAYVEKPLITVMDLTRDLNEGSEFVWVYLTDATPITSIEYRWGSSSTAYWKNTVTANQNSNGFVNGWNLLKFDWLTATKVGAPDVTKTAYIRTTLNYDGTALYNVRVNNFTSQLGSIYEIEYYSKFLFRDYLTGVFHENVANDNDIINLDTTSYNILFDIVGLFAAQQVQGTDGEADKRFFADKYKVDAKRYTDKIKAQVIKPQNFYYRMPNRRTTIVRPSSN